MSAFGTTARTSHNIVSRILASHRPRRELIVLHYPKIPGSKDAPLGRCVAFEKYDGTNLHWDWDRDFGWHAFGTRRDEYNLTPVGVEQFARGHAHLGEAPTLFLAGLADGIERVFRENAG